MVGHVPYMCPAAALNAGTGRDQVECEGTGKANGDGELMGNSVSCLKVFTHRNKRSNPFSRSI